MLKKQKSWGQHFVPKLLDRSEIGLPSSSRGENKLITKHIHTRGFVLHYTCIKAEFSPQSAFYT